MIILMMWIIEILHNKRLLIIQCKIWLYNTIKCVANSINIKLREEILKQIKDIVFMAEWAKSWFIY